MNCEVYLVETYNTYLVLSGL